MQLKQYNHTALYIHLFHSKHRYYCYPHQTEEETEAEESGQQGRAIPCPQAGDPKATLTTTFQGKQAQVKL